MSARKIVVFRSSVDSGAGARLGIANASPAPSPLTRESPWEHRIPAELRAGMCMCLGLWMSVRSRTGGLACAILLPIQVADVEFADGDVVELSPFVDAACAVPPVARALGLPSPPLCGLSWLAGAIVRGRFASSAESAVRF